MTLLPSGIYTVYMEIHVFSTLAYENKKGNQPNHDLDKETYIGTPGCPAFRTGAVHVHVGSTGKGEQKLEEMIEIMEDLQKYVCHY